MKIENLAEYARATLNAIDIDFYHHIADALDFYGEGELYELEHILASRKRTGRLILLGAELRDLGADKEILNDLFGKGSADNENLH